MKSYTIGVIGSHSAEEVGISAKANQFSTLVVCQKGRERFYVDYNSFLFSHILILESFNDMLNPENLVKLQKVNTIWFPNRSFSVYVDLQKIIDKKSFPIPIYGNRNLLQIEERRTQYKLLDKAGIKRPLEFKTPSKIDRLAIVKVQQKRNPLERAFFFVTSEEDYNIQSQNLLRKDLISEKGLKEAIIEEFIVGPRFNANFQAYGLSDIYSDFDFVGFDDRIQNNVTGLLNLPAQTQLKIKVPITNEEVGHKGITMRESKKPLVYSSAEKFIQYTRKEYSPGIIGLFALQGAINDDNEFVVFDISPRIPGSPCLGPTSPEMRRLSIKYNKNISSPLDLCMMDLKTAIEKNRLNEVTT